MKNITVEYKGIGDKAAQTITRECYSFNPAFDDYDNTFECEYQHQLNKLIEVIFAEYDITHRIEKMQAESTIPAEMSDDPEDDYEGLLGITEYDKKRLEWVDSKINDVDYMVRRFNDMFATPGKYGEYTKIVAVGD